MGDLSAETGSREEQASNTNGTTKQTPCIVWSVGVFPSTKSTVVLLVL